MLKLCRSILQKNKIEIVLKKKKLDTLMTTRPMVYWSSNIQKVIEYIFVLILDDHLFTTVAAWTI